MPERDAAGPDDACATDDAPLGSDGNALRLLPGGDETFAALLADIERATVRVWLECYIFVPDGAGRKFLVALRDAAARGCDVILLVDRFGSHALRERDVEPLCNAGGHAYWFNPFFGLRENAKKVTPFGIHRDHRKIMVIDDDVAYFGGRNVSMAWAGGGSGGGGLVGSGGGSGIVGSSGAKEGEEFYDVMVRAEGPAARDFAAVFLETLDDTTDLRRDLFPAARGSGDARVEVLQLDLREKEGELDHAICDLIANASGTLLFCTPYFIPPRPIHDALLDAARRGVDVRILTAGKCDVPWVMWAGRRLYPRFLAAGARIYEHNCDYLHAKFYVADGQTSIIGSYNADRWGQRFNQEDAGRIASARLAGELARCFEDGITDEVTPATVGAWAWYLVFFYRVMYALSHLIAPDASQKRRVPDRQIPEVAAAAADRTTAEGDGEEAADGEAEEGDAVSTEGRPPERTRA